MGVVAPGKERKKEEERWIPGTIETGDENRISSHSLNRAS